MTFLSELTSPLANWRVIYLRSTHVIRTRFARSYLGQGWITLSLTILIIATGLIWSLIWGLPVDSFLPYIGTGHVIYLFLSGVISESASAIINDASFYMVKKNSFFLSIYSLLVRNFIVLLYNIPIVIGLVLWSDSAQLSLFPLYVIFILVVLLFLFFLSFSIALVCIYFRDLIQLVASVMSVAFLLTPVLWDINVIPAHLRSYVYLNPLAAATELLRNPLIGLSVSDNAFFFMIAWSAFAFILSYITWKSLYREAIYWV